MVSHIPDGWTIDYNPKPIPDRRHDWDYTHEDHDGADGGDGLHGTAESFEAALAEVVELEAEREHLAQGKGE